MDKSIDHLLKPRYKVIADYPDSKFKVGEILFVPNPKEFPNWFQTNRRFNNEGRFEAVLEAYPHIFKKLEWWEHRTIEELKSIKYVKVIKYRGYWREGDVVPVYSFEGGSIEKAKPTGFNLKYKHFQPVFELLPGTEEEYLNQKSKTNG